MSVVILTEKELRRCVAVDREAVDAVAACFTALADGKAENPPIMHIEIAEHEGDIDIKSAFLSGFDRVAVKIAAGFYNNHKQGLPNSPASVVLVSARTGVVEAVLLDNAFLTDLRTGAAGAVAARHLAPAKVETAGVIGSGVQARYQMEALKLERDFERILVQGRSKANVETYVSEMAERLDVRVEAAPDMETLVRESQVVVTTTTSKAPLVMADWLHPGLLVTSVGSDLAGKQELEAACLNRAGLVVCDRWAQCSKMGELQHGALTEGQVTEIGEITAGRAKGRTSEDEIIVCDLTGTGAQDTAIGNVAYDKALAAGMGLRIE
ncbi:MAG: ornithine cyclodeaminase family protein, partial [Rhodospirillaceae bacterium]|nr:ornithine cyclodeaminase family protein [Rhodospirillaceae bacterium]